ncbi:hypothetical protein Tco_0845247, partial [Tanacetum coccineum]
MVINVRVERGLRMDHTNEEFRELSQRFVGFIPDAKEKFDRVVTTFPDTTFPFLDKVSQNSQSSLQDIARLEPGRVTPSHQTSSATTSLGANTHVRHSTSSSGNFGHTSTLEHLKKKKKPVEKGGFKFFWKQLYLLDVIVTLLTFYLGGYLCFSCYSFPESSADVASGYSAKSTYYARKGDVFVPLSSAAESISRGCSAQPLMASVSPWGRISRSHPICTE